jgi:hypothetical protein
MVRCMVSDKIVPVEFTGRPARAFYLRFDAPLFTVSQGSPLTGHSCIVVPPDYKYFRVVHEWLEAAESTDARHEQLLDGIGGFVRAAGTASVMYQTWPGLMKALKVTAPYRPLSPVTASHLDQVLPRKQRHYIEEQIASALMLDPYEPNAWCGFGPM